MRYLISIILLLSSTSGLSDKLDLVNENKISEITKNLISNKYGIKTDQLELTLVQAISSPQAGFTQIEAHLRVPSSKSELTGIELEFAEQNEERKNIKHYKFKSFTVMFNTKEIEKGAVIEGTTYVDE